MKSYREIADSVFARREQYVTAQRKKKKLLASAGATLCAVSLLGGSVWYLNRPTHDIPVVPATDDDAVTTTVTTAPTEQESTTTTANTPATNTTTDGGVVAPTTTVTTVTTVAPTQTTAKPTTGKTEPPKTTTTTGSKDKLVISGNGADTTMGGVDATTYFKHGEISPLLRQTMEQYKDTDAVFAVRIAVRWKIQASYYEAKQALIESDEMVKLAEQRELAYEAWQAAEEYRRANIGNDEDAAEIIADCHAKKDAYWALDREYEKRLKDLLNAYQNAGLDEALALLKEFSDIDLIPLKDLLELDMEWSEKAPIKMIVNAAQKDLAFIAVLSADEILELSERIGCMYWLDSSDDRSLVTWWR